MKKLNDVEEFLLKNWEGVMTIEEAAKSLRDKIDAMCEEVCDKLQKSDWWRSEEFTKPDYYGQGQITYEWQIYIWKKSWEFGKGEWDMVLPEIWALSPDDLMGFSEYKPCVCIWTDTLKGFNEDKKSLFEKRFNDYSKQIRASLPAEIKEVKDPESAFFYYLPYTPDQWIEILKEGRFVETILEHFDILAQFIEPIDRALAEVLGKKKGKK